MKLIQHLKRIWQARKVKLINEPEWVNIYQSTDEYSIRIKKLKLEDENIPARIFDQRDSSYNTFGFIYLHVRKEDEKTARKLLNLEHE